jgi:hypothetical protein
MEHKNGSREIGRNPLKIIRNSYFILNRMLPLVLRSESTLTW